MEKALNKHVLIAAAAAFIGVAIAQNLTVKSGKLVQGVASVAGAAVAIGGAVMAGVVKVGG